MPTIDHLWLGNVSLGNIAASGTLPAATTVDVASVMTIAQTTASISVTLPTPTITAAGMFVYIVSLSTSTQSITVNGTALAPSNVIIAHWASSPTGWVIMSGGGGGVDRGVAVRQTVSQSVPSGYALFDFDTIDYNNGFTVDTTANTITVLTTSVYLICYRFHLVATNALNPSCYLERNGSPLTGSVTSHPALVPPHGSGEYVPINFSRHYRLTAGDVIRMQLGNQGNPTFVGSALYHGSISIAQ